VEADLDEDENKSTTVGASTKVVTISSDESRVSRENSTNYMITHRNGGSSSSTLVCLNGMEITKLWSDLELVKDCYSCPSEDLKNHCILNILYSNHPSASLRVLPEPEKGGLSVLTLVFMQTVDCEFINTVADPRVWNDLPLELRLFPRLCTNRPTFLGHFKIYLFVRTGVGSASE